MSGQRLLTAGLWYAGPSAMAIGKHLSPTPEMPALAPTAEPEAEAEAVPHPVFVGRPAESRRQPGLTLAQRLLNPEQFVVGVLLRDVNGLSVLQRDGAE